MAENVSIKITKAENFPNGYFGEKNKAEKITKISSSNENKSKKLETENIKTDFASKYLMCAFSKCSSAISWGLNGAKRAFKETGAVIKESSAVLLSATIGKIKKIGLNTAVSLAMLLVFAVFIACFCTVGTDVYVDGAKIGTISSKSDFNALVSEINDEIMPYGETEFSSSNDVSFSPRLILKGDLTEPAEVKERLKSTSADMIPAYAIVVDGIPVLALASEDMAQNVLEDFKNNFKDGKESDISFLNDVKISHRFVPKTFLKTTESAQSMLLNGKHIHYTANKDDTLQSVAQKNNVSVETIMLSNTIEDYENLEGLTLDIYNGEPIIDVKAVSHVSEIESVAFETVKNEDSSKYVGTVEIKNEGTEGKKQIEAIVTTVNGVETERDVISETVLSNPENRVEIIGTKEKPSPFGTGDFAMPTSGQLSSRFGSRWGRQHKGIDLSANEGTPIYAADNGVVIYSEYNNGGFGYLIQIDHQNGYITYYAHCSKLVACEGDTVAKGDLIGYVGNTGNSTGAHLHFEVRKNGEPCDPMEFINE